MTEDEMVGWHHRLSGHEFEQAPGDGEGHESLACCSPWGHKESDMTERLNNNKSEGDPNLEGSQRKAGVLTTRKPCVVQSQKPLFFPGVLPQRQLKCQGP